MSRTTLDIDPTVLAELRERADAEGKSMSRLSSELLAAGLKQAAPAPARGFKLETSRMGRPLVDINDKEALWAALDGDD